MTKPRLHPRFIWPVLVAVLTILGTLGIGYQTSWSQGPSGNQGSDISALEQQSMLFQGDQQAQKIAGSSTQWHNDFGQPKPGDLVKKSSVWLLYYPASVINKPGQSVIGTWADPQLWDALQSLGIDALHTDPIERAGGMNGSDYTPTTDGWFDRINTDIDPQFGTENDFRQMVSVARQHGATIIGDLVPLHTGFGPDFRLAEQAYKDYPGMYDMVEIRQEDWGLLPNVSDQWGHDHVSRDAALQLKQKGYIPGLIHSADADPQANTWSGWSATGPVVGVDGKTRRWVYLHVFKPTQPALNWLDPSLAAPRAQTGDLSRNIVDRGAPVLRLDADTFLGLEPQPNSDMAKDYLTPLANNSTSEIAMAARKLGGFTYQEFAAPLAQLKQFAPNGPDMSYDFFTRAEGLYPLITGDATTLRLAHNFLLGAGVPQGTLIHDMQNHDEITFQLFELGAHGDVQFEGKTVNGMQLKEQVLSTMRARVGDSAAPYNRLYRPEQDGIATTYAGFIAAALGIKDPYNATPDQVALIRRAHLLVAHANAMQPGVFGISAWDLVGALPIPANSVPNNLTAGGDWRWINRGAVDLMGVNPSGDKSAVLGLPKAKALYGSLPDQLKSPDSFASQLKRMLAAREKYGIAEGTVLAVPTVTNPALCILVMKLPTSNALAITALNFGRSNTSVDVDLSNIPGVPAGSAAGQKARDIVADQDAGTVSNDGRLTVQLDSLSGKTIVLQGK